MRKLHTALLAAGSLALAAGAAHAAGKLNTMNVALPDGTVAQIAYEGDVPPRLAVVPVAAADPFAELERMSAMMQAQHEAMMRQVAQLQQQAQQQVLAAQHSGAGSAGADPRAGQVVVSSNLPVGSYSYTMVSTTTAGNGCTQTVEWRSDGSAKEPQVTKTSAGDCSAVPKNAPAIPAAAPARPDVPAIPAAVVAGQARVPAKAT